MNCTTQAIRIPAEPEGAYEVRIGSGLLAQALDAVAERFPGHRPFLVTDANVERSGHAAALIGESNTEGFVIDPPGEQSKTMRTVESIIAEMETKKFGRDTVIIALGGGTVGDMAGFAAAIFKRGVPCVQIPTTTVAQADSAIGGKTGVDSDLSKNAFGAFHHPAMVIVDCSTLKTLDDRHFRAGLVESIKHAMILDADYFDTIESNLDAILARDEDILCKLAQKNTAIKGRVVYEDPREKNLRRILNFGHTLGHAVETESDYSLLHGEAVAIGIMAACRIAEALDACSDEVGARACALFERLGLPLALPAEATLNALMDTMTRDKKAVGGLPRFILLDALGSVYAPADTFGVEVPPDILESVITRFDKIQD
jgi:3-dehydroquinate synthase